MTHTVLPKSEPSPTSQSLQTALQMDPQQPQQPAQQPAQPARKRKKNDLNDEPAEPRRLRRSHEACARCRSKKIKASPVPRMPPAAISTFTYSLLIERYLLTPVRLQTSKMHRLRQRWHSMPSRGQTQANSHSERIYRAPRAPIEAMRGPTSTPHPWVRPQ